ncbi:hypothetical protein [Enterovibrio norvegicus]|uniref:hypothetical protein n=1 Tax=Enterovibrio norvegicus TaxID=188144 RepID=UPI000C83906F|nr:hypothetical protein [Enterovibrio norvegicus]PMH64452.1 hypothetical protein BCU62_15470 [Enterovibrio norvegicus]
MKNVYTREKRSFAKLVIEQYQTLGRPVGRGRFCEEYRRLRDYSEVLFLATGMKRASIVTPADIYLAVTTIKLTPEHRQQMLYVAELAVSALTGGSATSFVGSFTCGVCGGEYSLTSTGSYHCNGCHAQGRSDQHDFPVSLPASASVRYGRKVFHELVREIRSHGVTEEEAYILVAFESRMPLPIVHAGLCTSETQIAALNKACNRVINQLMLERA